MSRWSPGSASSCLGDDLRSAEARPPVSSEEHKQRQKVRLGDGGDTGRRSETQELQTHLVHHQRLDLPLEHLHAGRGDHRAHVGHHDLAEDVADEPVVPLEAGGCRVLDGKTVVVVWAEDGR